MKALCCMTGSTPKSIQDMESHTNEIFHKIDINQDGTISESEFLTFIGKDIEVS